MSTTIAWTNETWNPTTGCTVILHRRRSETKSGLCRLHHVMRIRAMGTASVKAGLA